MTKYIIYPCVDSKWIKIFKKISAVAKKSVIQLSHWIKNEQS